MNVTSQMQLSPLGSSRLGSPGLSPKKKRTLDLNVHPAILPAMLCCPSVRIIFFIVEIASMKCFRHELYINKQIPINVFQ